jgi:3-(3-hydroxy-phenyl)propionate hydroxylase
MSIENQYTVLIVGAGPVGLVAANYLDKFQIKSLLIDKKSEAYTYPRAIGIDDESLRLLRVNVRGSTSFNTEKSL